MTKFALKGLLGRKLRAILTALAIVLGVAMIAGTFVLTDTINKAFNTIFTQSYKNTSAVISSKSAIDSSNSGAATASGFPSEVLQNVRALPDVQAAVGSIEDQAKLIGRDGKAISTGGAPNLALSVDPSDPGFNPLTLTAGSWPHGPDQVAIDKGTADKKHFGVGDTVGVAARGPVQSFKIVGVAKFGNVASIGGATIAIFDVPTAQKLFDKQGKLDIIRIAAKPNVPEQKLVSEIRPSLPPTAQIRTASQQAKADSKDTSNFLGIIQKILLAFGGIALFVGAFVIFNTLSITVAQRTREFATLRTIGASRRQLMRAVLLEGFVIGVIASVIGLAFGYALAAGMNALFVAFGIDLPKSGTVFAARTIIVSLIVGTLMTLLATIVPALRATRVPPIAAVREGATLPPSRLARHSTWIAGVVTALAVGLLCYGVFIHGIATKTRLFSLAGGCLLLFVGIALLSSRIARPLAAVLGWPATRIGGAAGRLARENAMRNPSRTAATAAALMIGLALVTFVAVLGQGLRTSFEQSVNDQFHADYAVTSQNGFDPIAPAAADSIKGKPGVLVDSSVRIGDGRAFGDHIGVTAVDSQVGSVIKIVWKQGSPSTPGQLGQDGAFVSDKYAKDHHLSLGSPVALETPSGKVLNLRLKGIFDEPNGGSPFGDVTISTQAFDASFPQPANLYTFLKVKGGVTDANTARLKAALAGFPDAKAQTEADFKKNQEAFINVLLNLLYVLLALSIVVSLFGIVNTLVLSVFERTREIGMLRAVGMTRRQVRRMIRHESIVTALIGAALGIAVGFFLAALVTVALRGQGIVFAVPVASIAVFVLAAIVAGGLAAIFPARRASRLNVLEALQYE
ncbi:MAG: ABC transporter permease [Actinobacteria bacterium]|nr:MAG: ABC transporter permease [Actinomycetota bacterium]